MYACCVVLTVGCEGQLAGLLRGNVGWQWRAGEEMGEVGEGRGSGDGEEGGDSGEASSLERELSEEERARGRGLSQ